MEENIKIKKMIKRSIIVFLLVLIIAIIALIILKYHVEGEQNMPFELSDLLVVSTAEGYQEKESVKNKWDVEVYQTNDIYLTIKKNKNYKEVEKIKSIEIKNIKIENEPAVGKVSFYLPEGEEQSYQYSKAIIDNAKFEGDVKSNISNLKIANQGGNILFRVVNKTGKRYVSNEDELKHDGTLLKQVNLQQEDIKTKISFEIVIHLESEVSFVGKVILDLPSGDITTQGISNLDKNQIEDIIFKRE